ncbi:MAG: DUF1318 domain-containing protein [Candidatus Omnitrophota bacterium]|nr:DUF1318 domain-containing protein [Candidatus Omnitrophota bacterium]
MEITKRFFSWTAIGMGSLALIGSVGCRATVAGDPDRPIKIEAHVTIDVRQIKEEAHSIEDLVNSPAPKKSSRVGGWLVGTAWAEFSPEVMDAVNSRRDRVGQLKSAKAQGLIGEDNQGHVAALGGGPEIQALVEAENRDRETIYQAQVQEKGLPADAIGTVRAAFAQEQWNRAEPGEKIQTPSGEWQTK